MADGQVITDYRGNKTLLLSVAWTAAAGGTKADIAIDLDDYVKSTEFHLTECRTYPGGTAPAANYGIAVNDVFSKDLMIGAMADLSATAFEVWYPYNGQGVASPQLVTVGTLTLVFSDVTNANATGTVQLIFTQY